MLKSYAVDSEALAAAIREANEGKDDKLKVLKSDLARLQKQHSKVEEQITTLLDVMEQGGDTAPVLQGLKQRQSRAEAYAVEIAAIKGACSTLERQFLDLEVVSKGYLEFPVILERAQELKLEKPLQALLQSVIDVIVWKENSEDRKEGWAEVQLFPVPEEVLALSAEARAAVQYSKEELAGMKPKTVKRALRVRSTATTKRHHSVNR
ncbi:MAG: hypothetical protein GY822_21265 [Deltaproteobacteria bacterium]|nr:hypothetical protein [Deltaproteobacteria bacterium]